MAQVLGYYATGGPAPERLIELILCRDVYHCTPVQLQQVDLATIAAHLTCISAEAGAQEVHNNDRLQNLNHRQRT